jgi:putative hydrolase of the HAD superfamily
VAVRRVPESLVQKLIENDCRSWGNLNQGTLTYIQKLKSSGKSVGLLSNLPIDLVHNLRKNFSFLGLFDHIFFSSEIKLTKPHIEIYEYVLRMISKDASSVIFFDDREENLKGAVSAGLKTFLFRPMSAEELLKEI